MHGFRFAAIGVILVWECHTGVIHGINPAVADGTAEDVACEVCDGIAESMKGFLDMRDPVFVIKSVYEFLPFITVTEI